MSVLANNELPVMWRNYAAEITAAGFHITAVERSPYAPDKHVITVWSPPSHAQPTEDKLQFCGRPVSARTSQPHKHGLTISVTIKDSDA